MRKSILFVEDNTQLRTLLVEILAVAMDVVVTEACNCAEGRFLLKNTTFDAVVLDGSLPDGKGPDLYTEFRDQLLAQETIVVVYSGDEASELHAKYPQLANDHVRVLLKGFDDLSSTLKVLLFP